MNNYIYAKVFTNLDDYKFETFPHYFVAVPRLGERIEAKSGKTLKIVGITYTQSKNGEPNIIVELNK